MRNLSSNTASASKTAARFLLRGSVQGIGIRPAVARLAIECNLCGFVTNQLGGVQVHVEGDARAIESFSARLRSSLPSAAEVRSLQRLNAEVCNLRNFEIRTVDATGPVATSVPRDQSVCRQCLDEVADEANRRSNYAFTSCTKCGPRYSIIKQMPYEREQTAMQEFVLCRACLAEYSGGDDRRFHAQTNACEECGPEVWCEDGLGERTARGQNAIRLAANVLIEGSIIALKGIGGYQLLCDATNETAVRRMRDRKRRPTKPFPILIKTSHTSVDLPPALFDPSNPIVPIAAESIHNLAESIHPNLKTVGVMLPTTPLHWLLLRECGRPLVITSGNIEGEPLALENAVAMETLSEIADLFLHHDREIISPVDDSVVQVANGRRVTIRAARGVTPLTLNLRTTQSILAVGGHQKVAVALSNEKQSVLGAHLGDLDSLAARKRFGDQTLALLDLYGCKPEFIVHDLHPDYFTTRWAADQSQPTMAVQHHHAHIASGMLEHGWLDRTVLGVAFDGTGYGTDDTIWGGEFLIANATEFERVAHLRPFVLPGGEAAIRQPLRIALSLLTDALGGKSAIDHLQTQTETFQWRTLAKLLVRTDLSPITTSAGRLFDGVASLLLPLEDLSFEGEPAMRLEAVCDVTELAAYQIPIVESDERSPTGKNVLQLDWRPMLVQIVADLRNGVETGAIAMRFHRGIAVAIASIVKRFANLPVVISGGCFQNQTLVSLLEEQLTNHPQPVGCPGDIPPNDGGLAAGQLAVAAARLAATNSLREPASCV